MKYELQLKAQAVDDMTEAFNWYEGQQEGLGKRFLDEVEKYLALITTSPGSFQRLGHQRFAVMRQFPFKIIFGTDQETIYVFRVFHSRRNPGQLNEA